MLEQGRGALGKKGAGAGHFRLPQAEEARKLLPEPSPHARWRWRWRFRGLRRLGAKHGRRKGQAIGQPCELLHFKIESHRINARGAAKSAEGRSEGAAQGDITGLVSFREHRIGPLKKAYRARYVPLQAKTLRGDGAEIANLCKTDRRQAAHIGFRTLGLGRELRRQRLLPCSGLRERILRQAQRIALGRKGQGLRPGLLAKVSKLGAEGCLKLLDFRLALLSQIKGVGGAACGPEGEKEGQPAQRTPPSLRRL